MRRLEVISKKKYDVLIIDHVTSYWIEYCIPKGRTHFTLKIHNTLPLIRSFSFLCKIFKCFVKNGVNSTSLLSAIILELNPKVVITLADNNKFMGALQSIFPDVLIISAQNGIRATDNTMQICKKHFTLPHYFGFGDYELSRIKEKGASVARYYSRGSLRMGVFVSNIYRATEKGGGICIISQYVGRSPDSFVDAFYLKFTEIYREISQLVLKFAQESGVKVVVAMRSQISDKNYRDELAFYQSIFKDCEVSLRANDRRSMTSYQVGMDSDLIVSFDSTLLFELFGMGKKILCCGNADEEYQNVWSNVDGFGNKGQCERLPYDTLLDSWDYGDFTKKAKRLLKMNNDEFYDTTQDSRKWYMNFGDEYPHRIVYNAIQKKMSEKD